jgi:hypothetical protein
MPRTARARPGQFGLNKDWLVTFRPLAMARHSRQPSSSFDALASSLFASRAADGSLQHRVPLIGCELNDA